MFFTSPQGFRDWDRKAVTVFGMSGVGKTTVASMLRSSEWFHYSVDFRIGTRYMGEHIVDNFKREAMKVKFLRDLLISDSIYISSNISFNNLDPLSTYLGKPGKAALGGISFPQYRKRQEQHRVAEIAALRDVPAFIEKARDIYDYDQFICDSGGSLCHVVDPDDPKDPVLSVLAKNTLLLYIRGTAEHAAMLVERFKADPKPMHYPDDLLCELWNIFKRDNDIRRDRDVDPNAFAVWGFEQLLHTRIPLYEAIAAKHGYTVEAEEMMAVKSAGDFVDLIATAISRRTD
ncbi:MAG: ATPase [Hyphomicrobiales bacterium]|nr:MAG: ATPase [Hyphomicrobiales bacterium]